MRPRPDPFSVCDQAPPGTRPSQRSYEIAWSLTTILGETTAFVHAYLEALSRAPTEHLELLARRGAAIIFAPTIPHGLLSRTAALRRGRGLTATEKMKISTEYSQAAGTVAVYDPSTDALIFPTTYGAGDAEWPVLHELGHALTLLPMWDTAHARHDLLENLPTEVAAHLERYSPGDTPSGVRERVLEVLAEGYVRLVVERGDELPPRLTSALYAILNG